MAFDGAYRPRNPEENPLYKVVSGHLKTFLARQRERDRNVPGFVESEFRSLGSGTIYGEQVAKPGLAAVMAKISFT